MARVWHEPRKAESPMGNAQAEKRVPVPATDESTRGCSSSVLAVDVGNSVTNLGLFVSDSLVATWTITTPERLTPDEARMATMAFLDSLVRDGGATSPSDSIIASVVPDLTDVWVEALRCITARRPLVVGPGLKTGVKMRYNDPGELGADRMADLVAAKELFEPPFVVVDLGTTTNFEVVDEDGLFIGGVIAPGLKLSARAVSEGAARLAMIELKAPSSIIGKNTREAMQAGIVMGEVARIDGIIDMIRSELGYTPDVVVTGSEAGVMAALSQRINRAEEHLTLQGLHILHAMNRR